MYVYNVCMHKVYVCVFQISVRVLEGHLNCTIPAQPCILDRKNESTIYTSEHIDISLLVPGG